MGEGDEGFKTGDEDEFETESLFDATSLRPEDMVARVLNIILTRPRPVQPSTLLQRYYSSQPLLSTYRIGEWVACSGIQRKHDLPAESQKMTIEGGPQHPAAGTLYGDIIVELRDRLKVTGVVHSSGSAEEGPSSRFWRWCARRCRRRCPEERNVSAEDSRFGRCARRCRRRCPERNRRLVEESEDDSDDELDDVQDLFQTEEDSFGQKEMSSFKSEIVALCVVRRRFRDVVLHTDLWTPEGTDPKTRSDLVSFSREWSLDQWRERLQRAARRTTRGVHAVLHLRTGDVIETLHPEDWPLERLEKQWAPWTLSHKEEDGEVASMRFFTAPVEYYRELAERLAKGAASSHQRTISSLTIISNPRHGERDKFWDEHILRSKEYINAVAKIFKQQNWGANQLDVKLQITSGDSFGNLAFEADEDIMDTVLQAQILIARFGPTMGSYAKLLGGAVKALAVSEDVEVLRVWPEKTFGGPLPYGETRTTTLGGSPGRVLAGVPVHHSEEQSSTDNETGRTMVRSRRMSTCSRRGRPTQSTAGRVLETYLRQPLQLEPFFSTMQRDDFEAILWQHNVSTETETYFQFHGPRFFEHPMQDLFLDRDDQLRAILQNAGVRYISDPAQSRWRWLCGSPRNHRGGRVTQFSMERHAVLQALQDLETAGAGRIPAPGAASAPSSSNPWNYFKDKESALPAFKEKLSAPPSFLESLFGNAHVRCRHHQQGDFLYASEQDQHNRDFYVAVLNCSVGAADFQLRKDLRSGAVRVAQGTPIYET